MSLNVLPTGEALKTELAYREYVHRGLQIPARLVAEDVRAVVVFDVEYEMTQHMVVGRTAEDVTLGPAVAYTAEAVAEALRP